MPDFSRVALGLCFLATSAVSAKLTASDDFRQPKSEAVDSVNPLIGNGGPDPNMSGGMIPSVAPPFGMTRWVAQTRENYVSMLPYNHTDSTIHGFQGTHQPAIWMGESGQVVVVPGYGDRVKDLFEDRGMSFSHENEVMTPSYYAVELDEGKVKAEMSATSRVSHLRFTFSKSATNRYVLVQATRPTIVKSDKPGSDRTIYPNGTISVDTNAFEICGTNEERQDSIIAPVSTPAKNWKGYFCARFSRPIVSFGIAQNGTIHEGEKEGKGGVLSAYARFGDDVKIVDARVGVSFISIEQARKNIDNETPKHTELEHTAHRTRHEWAEKLDRIRVSGANETEKTIFYTAAFHALQYPYEIEENGKYYSGYDDKVHEGISYSGYSIWDTYRAEWAWLILMAPERVPAMITSMLQDYKEGGWLPMWKNIIETNIMIATHADSLIAEAIVKGITDFDTKLAWEAVLKDGTVAPIDDEKTRYADREEGVDYEVRAGLNSVYAQKGWVAEDVHSEAASRTLGYAYDDYAVAVMAEKLGVSKDVVDKFKTRAFGAPWTIYNNETGFMNSKYANGSWAGERDGWTEGDKWAYSFDVAHDIPTLITHRGGNEAFVQSLDDHFNGGHNEHTNEPSHHIPYLYALAGRADKTQEKVREVARDNYFDGPLGLTGNEDCGQMSAWYLFSAMGFYPVDPVSGEYIVGSPFFDKVSIHLPGSEQPLVISSEGAKSKPYIRSLTINGKKVDVPVVKHDDIKNGGRITFEMSDKATSWGRAGVQETNKEEREMEQKQESGGEGGKRVREEL